MRTDRLRARHPRLRPTPAPALATAALVVATCALTGCSPSGGDPDADVTGVPDDWRTSTAKAWPDSDSFGSSIPVYARGACLLGAPPNPLDAGPETTDVGFLALGDATDLDSYGYDCQFWAPDLYAGSLRLYQAGDAAALDGLVADFVGASSSTNTVTHSDQTSHGASVSVTRTAINGEPAGKVEALYVDEDALAAVVLEVNSLDEKEFGEYTDAAAAEELMRTLAVANG
ncbi:MAG TPA: hypothetical protein DHV14_05675 [Micrococcales bacterium]|uniref:hypothetical protein n=1 Tax=Miniimonas arenae TaxID=676201 RepID=UPI000EDEEEBD|nr:hypothetical protein [Miniimonas arenae]HCX84619.1 hypothetical protein [Micrococcales bacterium]